MDLLPTSSAPGSKAELFPSELPPAAAERGAAAAIVFSPRVSDSSRVPWPESQQRRAYVLLLCLVLAAGTFLRLPASLFEKGAPLASWSALHPNPGFPGTGFDESLYRGYV